MRRISVLAAMAFAVLGATAAMGADPTKTIDVTAKVQAAVKENALTILADNETMGDDPASGEFKKLRIEYTVGEAARSTAWGEDDTAKIEVPAGAGLSVKKATYGVLDEPIVVTAKVAELVKEGALNVAKIEDETFGRDPNPGLAKELVLVYRADGKVQMLRAKQNDPLKIESKDGKLEIVWATYGPVLPGGDMTAWLTALVESNKLAGPTIHGGELTVDYMVDGKARQARFMEGQTVALPKAEEGTGTLVITGAVFTVPAK